MDSQGKFQTLTSFHDHMAIGGDGSEKVQTSCWDWHRSLQTDVIRSETLYLTIKLYMLFAGWEVPLKSLWLAEKYWFQNEFA